MADLWVIHLVAEEAAIFSWMTFRKSNRVLVVAFFAELFRGFFPISLEDIVKTLMIIIVGDATGRFRWGLPEECEDHDSDSDQ